MCRYFETKQTPEKALFDMFQKLHIEQYKKSVLQQRYLVVLRDFHKRAKILSYLFYTIKIIITVGSILVPALLSIQGSTVQTQIYWTTWLISVSVTVSNGFLTLFKLDKKYFFIHTTLEMLHSEGWQYIGLSGRYSPKDAPEPPTHENQFLVFFHMAEKIKMRQVEEEYWKFTDTSGVGNATNQKASITSPTPITQQGQLASLPDEQKNVIERWVGDMNTNMLGLQPRQSNMLSRVDGKRRSSGISKSPSQTPVSMQSDLSTPTITGRTMVRIPQEEPTPENTFIKVVPKGPTVGVGAKEGFISVE
jgi:hypothetical protein